VDLNGTALLPLDLIMIPIQIILSVTALYFFVLGMAGVVHFRIPKAFDPHKRFAVIVPAHNEEAVIGNLIDNLLDLTYPKDLYDVFVIADNSSDSTAKTAREHGAIVYERFDDTQKGKGFALEWMFNKLYNMSINYDAVVIFDADNLVDPKFLQHMNNRLCDGAKIVQGYIDAKNPSDTWVTASFAMAFWVANRMLQLARYNLGLSNYLGGTGMAISLDVLKEIGWGATSLTEDLEFSIKALLHGYKTTWAHEAFVYDEKPLTFKQAWNQRRRWALGHVEVFRTYCWLYIKQTWIKKDFALLDGVIMIIQPLLAVAMGFFSILGLLNFKFPLYTPIFQYIWPPFLWALVSTLQLMYPFLVMWIDKLPKRVIKWTFVHYLIFVYSWIPIITISLFAKTRVSWSHTVHTRNINYADIIRER
jgi:cellulose synthase/poly-beta-1,6-N-acetylglucosamine synthase-like glycosyltransferase